MNRPQTGRSRAWLLSAAVLVVACHHRAGTPYTIVAQWPHDTTAFTEGLVHTGEVLYESTGLRSRSEVRRVDPRTGRVLAATPLAADRFGEGLALLRGRLYQLTWTSKVGYVYDAATLAPVDSFSYGGEGWGLTTDGTWLIMSDGTDTLRFLDPDSFRVVRMVTVHENGKAVRRLNELEYVRGELLANVYPHDRVARIDPASGKVCGWLDFRKLFRARKRNAAYGALNGLAFDERTGRLFVTGKFWPMIFEIQGWDGGSSAACRRG